MSPLYVFSFVLAVALTEAAINCDKICKGDGYHPRCMSDGTTVNNACNLLKKMCKDKSYKATVLYEKKCIDFSKSIPRPETPQPKSLFQPINCTLWNRLSRRFPCPRISNPRCGNDLEDYDNNCQMCRAGKARLLIKHMGRCNKEERRLAGKPVDGERDAERRAIDPRYPPRKLNCPGTWVPCGLPLGYEICAQDGNKTIDSSNECFLCNSMLERADKGKNVEITKFAIC